jgi:hypothetical protein
MSTCISSAGEFSEHEIGSLEGFREERFTCRRCFVLDEDAIFDAIDRVVALVAAWQANGNSRPLGDPTEAIWHEAARQLLAVLDGKEPTGW